MKKFLFISAAILFLAILATASKFQEDFEASDGWRITGYFTPVETDYDSGETREVKIKNFGREKFDKAFLDTVFDETKGYGEGWGKTRFGWYLGNYDGAWHKADAPLDANNAPLQKNSVAVDNDLIPNDSEVRIPSLPDGFGEMTFIANDVGVTVHGKHIDVYCGEGKAAMREMYRITREDRDDLTRVYFKRP
ncbi:MAG: 3D domain-containing protein [Pyrinomonadaceae bacterium]